MPNEQSFYIKLDGTISRLPRLSSIGEEKIREVFDELVVSEAERIISGEPEEPEVPSDKYSSPIPQLTIEVEEGGFTITGVIPDSGIVSLIKEGDNIADFFHALSDGNNMVIIIRQN